MNQTCLEQPPPRRILPVLERLKQAYLLWCLYHAKLPKTHKHTLGNRIDELFVQIIESAAYAAFLTPSEKLPVVSTAIRKLDTLKILLMVLWESHSLDTKKYIALSTPLDEAGRMLGGWQGQLRKQNSSELAARRTEEK
jgi:hypothetical protein